MFADLLPPSTVVSSRALVPSGALINVQYRHHNNWPPIKPARLAAYRALMTQPYISFCFGSVSNVFAVEPTASQRVECVPCGTATSECDTDPVLILLVSWLIKNQTVQPALSLHHILGQVLLVG